MNISVKERPILFSAPMVRAILEDRKMQTRRTDKYMTKFPPTKMPDIGLFSKSSSGDKLLTATWIATNFKFTASFCPYGKPGDQLWVRESWRADVKFDHTKPCDIPAGSRVLFEADYIGECHLGGKLRPSIFMPRWASRIVLEITNVRVERLQDISRGDAMGEGCPFPNMAQGDDPRKWYADLWNSINGSESWDINPWVWVIEFKVAKP